MAKVPLDLEVNSPHTAFDAGCRGGSVGDPQPSTRDNSSRRHLGSPTIDPEADTCERHDRRPLWPPLSYRPSHPLCLGPTQTDLRRALEGVPLSHRRRPRRLSPDVAHDNLLRSPLHLAPDLRDQLEWILKFIRSDTRDLSVGHTGLHGESHVARSVDATFLCPTRASAHPLSNRRVRALPPPGNARSL